MRRDVPHILLINPWIHDFAAYDFWAKPMGLLTIAGILQSHGYQVSYVDCLDRFHPKLPQTDPFLRNGRGPYHKKRIAKPAGLEDVPRYYCRYGIEPDWLRQDLSALPRPDLILVTSIMTYWYPGVKETISVVRQIFKDTPIILGGIYARLYPDHARMHMGADQVVTNPDLDGLFETIRTYTGVGLTGKFDPDDLDAWPRPAFELQRQIGYVPILTSRGCPFACQYCASHYLEPKRFRRSPESVLDEIRYWHHTHGIRDFVFYDDALLADLDRHAIPLLSCLADSGLPISFHTPNAVHIRNITREVATLMYRAGFRTLRLGLETVGMTPQQRPDTKVTDEEFVQAAKSLREIGFTNEQVGAYLLSGLPGQSMEAVANAIAFVKSHGIQPILAYYSPIPHTRLWKDAVVHCRYNLELDPIFSNNAIFPCSPEGFSWQMITRLKQMTKQ